MFWKRNNFWPFFEKNLFTDRDTKVLSKKKKNVCPHLKDERCENFSEHPK